MLDQREANQIMRSGGDIYAVFERYGSAWRADEEGEVVVPWQLGSRGVLAGKHEGLVGFVPIERVVVEPFELELRQSSDLLALVVDVAGQPLAEAPVAVRVGYGDMRTDALQVSTDASGIARFRDFSQLAGEMRGGGSRLFLGLACPLSEPVESEIDPEELPTEPVRLMMPPSGVVEIVLLDVQGEPLAARVGVALLPEVTGESSLEPLEPLEARMVSGNISHSRMVVEDGVAHFPYVGLGLALMVTAELEDGSAQAAAEFSGPFAMGASVRHELRFEALTPFVVGRAMSSAGEPWAERPMSVSLALSDAEAGSSRSEGILSVRTDEAGFFRIAIVTEDAREGAGPGALGLGSIEGEEQFTSRALHLQLHDSGIEMNTSVDLPRSLPAGGYELGEVLFAPPPVQASGRVLGPDGAGLSGAYVSLQQERSDGGGATPSRWSRLRGSSTRTSGDGSFELLGEVESGGGLRVQASARGYRSGHTEAIAAGSHGIELRLEAAASMRGSVLVDAEIPDGSVSFRARMEGEQDWKDARVLSGGEFVWDTLEPGRYEFRLAISGLVEALLEVGGLEVISGEACEDARLQEIDLRGRLVSFEVQVEGVDGERIERSLVRTLGDEGQLLQLSHLWRGQGLELVTTLDRPLNLLVSARGYRSERREGVLEDIVVVMRPGIPLRIHAPALASLGEPWEVWIGARPLDGQSSVGASFELVSAVTGDVDLHVESPGRYALMVSLNRLTDTGRQSVDLDLANTSAGEPFLVEEGGLVLDVDIPTERIAAAQAEFQ